MQELGRIGAIRRIWTAYKAELTKAVRLKFTYVGLVLVVLAVLLSPLIHPLEKDGTSDYGFIAYSTQTALSTVGFLLILVYCSGLVSSELGHGTIRMVLVRPVLRRDFIFAKLFWGMTYATALGVVVALTSWSVAYIFGELSGIGYGGEIIYTARDMTLTYWLAFLAGLVPLFAAVGYGVMISSLTKNVGAATGITLGIWILLDIVKYPLRIAPFLFSTYLESSWQVFADKCDGLSASWMPAIQYNILTSVVWFVLFALVSWYALHRRNLSG